MKNLIFNYQGKQIKRVNKSTAKRLFEQGETVYLIPCNLSPTTAKYYQVNTVNNTISDYNFLEIANIFSFYNCKTSQTGYYTSFYVEL